MKCLIVQTAGFINQVSDKVKARIMSYALKRINPKTNFIAFYEVNAY